MEQTREKTRNSSTQIKPIDLIRDAKDSGGRIVYTTNDGHPHLDIHRQPREHQSKPHTLYKN